MIAETMPALLKFVEDILRRDPFVSMRMLWECLANSVRSDRTSRFEGARRPERAST